MLSKKKQNLFPDQANSSVEKSAILAMMKMKILECDENGILKPETLNEAIKNDYNMGRFPCYVRFNFEFFAGAQILSTTFNFRLILFNFTRL